MTWLYSLRLAFLALLVIAAAGLVYLAGTRDV